MNLSFVQTPVRSTISYDSFVQIDLELLNSLWISLIFSGGEEVWDRIASAHTTPSSTFVVLNNAYSTSYDLGNKRGYEEAYYLKRISKGWVFRGQCRMKTIFFLT